MARMVITTVGSAGDLNPFVALGLGLRARGHEVSFALEEHMRPPVEAFGFPVSSLTGVPETALAQHDERMFLGRDPFATLRVIVNDYLVPTLRPKVDELNTATQGADLLIASSVQLAAAISADLTGVRLVSVALSPVFFPSAYLEPQPLPFSLPPRLQYVANQIGWGVGGIALRRLVDVPVNRVRVSLGLPPKRNLMQEGSASHELTAVAISPAFLPPPPDWPPYVHETGFMFWDTPGDWEEPPALTEFLAHPGPVVAFSSGSMSMMVNGAFDSFYRTSLDAVLRVGSRALVIGVDADVLGDVPAGQVFALPFAPFSSVYPRCTAIISHGGIGTVAQTLRAGVPTLIIPWGADQFFNGAQLARLGVGRWIQRRGYTVDRATTALTALLGESRYRARAHQIAERIQAEDGVATLVNAIESHLALPVGAG